MSPLISWGLFILAFIYNILDAWHTKLLIATNVIEEANPLMNYFIQNYGINSCFVIKIVLFVILGFGLVLHQREYKER